VRIEREVKLDYSDVLFRPKRSTLSSRSDVRLQRGYSFVNSHNVYAGIPIMAANMDGVGTLDMARTLIKEGLFTCLAKSYSRDEVAELFAESINVASHVAVSTGITQADRTKIDIILQSVPGVQYVCIDVANGYSESFIDFVKQFRQTYPGITIIAGNVVTADVTEELILAGADIVKVGIGPGSVCTTRIKTGVGYPQLSAVIECADAAHGLGGHIIADGGCTCPGDVAKAFGAGADFVMLGGMLAGTDQGGGKVITELYESNELQARQRTLEDGQTEWSWTGRKTVEKHFVEFYGMSSTAAQEKHGGTKEYRASEGRVVSVPYRGDVQPIIRDILGGIRSTCTYVGASCLKQLPKRTTFVQVNNQYNHVYEGITNGE
jgi:GMP reductase